MAAVISDETIRRMIEDFSNTSSGRRQIEKWMKENPSAKKRNANVFTPYYTDNKHMFKKLSQITPNTKSTQKPVQEMVDILYNSIISNTKTQAPNGGIREGLASFDKGDIIAHYPRSSQMSPFKTPGKKWDGQYYVAITFNSEALHRESLDPKRFDGVEDIVSLFTKGYSARGSVHGVWKTHSGERVASLRHREPNDFMQIAVDEFNKIYGDKAMAYIVNPAYAR